MYGPLLEVTMSQKCRLLWCEARLQVKMYKTPHVRTTFGSYDVAKVNAAVVRSTFPSQNVQKTTCTDHFWKLRCRKGACLCGARSTLPSQNVQNTTCTDYFWTLSFRVAGAGDCAPCQKSAKREGFCSSFNYNHQYTTLHSTTLHHTTPHRTTQHSTTLHHLTLYYITLNYITLPQYIQQLRVR